ncbi:hypothetical protein PTSG_11816 [Salpingoeca rosetta]|uniref:Uncharacterized protein n=1 Tax=Salpingoeca rosetta (strain ATCC 50818 / BSB-021) TaxID=946362 RepID=F2TZI3_SALR5|nr:uncharacterized protein PTSG_11816 [Salpingoeca rosetta]EGD79007.1 hypothetical protein PTSG_11816 [Salpingoeca rosetta]|eukprot:XP_004997963.1 hypothetical protein PTSG_11816 [Salpingoeca rosetta]
MSFWVYVCVLVCVILIVGLQHVVVCSFLPPSRPPIPSPQRTHTHYSPHRLHLTPPHPQHSLILSPATCCLSLLCVRVCVCFFFFCISYCDWLVAQVRPSLFLSTQCRSCCLCFAFCVEMRACLALSCHLIALGVSYLAPSFFFLPLLLM